MPFHEPVVIYQIPNATVISTSHVVTFINQYFISIV